MKYLLDTNICIYFLNGQLSVFEKIQSIGFNNCSISEITLAELLFGAEKSQRVEQNRQAVFDFIYPNHIEILPISSAVSLFAKEKARLQKIGCPVDDFDLLIGSSAVVNQLIMVTRNVRHFKHISNIQIENWLDNP